MLVKVAVYFLMIDFPALTGSLARDAGKVRGMPSCDWLPDVLVWTLGPQHKVQACDFPEQVEHSSFRARVPSTLTCGKRTSNCNGRMLTNIHVTT